MNQPLTIDQIEGVKAFFYDLKMSLLCSTLSSEAFNEVKETGEAIIDDMETKTTTVTQ